MESLSVYPLPAAEQITVIHLYLDAQLQMIDEKGLVLISQSIPAGSVQTRMDISKSSFRILFPSLDRWQNENDQNADQALKFDKVRNTKPAVDCFIGQLRTLIEKAVYKCLYQRPAGPLLSLPHL